MTKYNEEFKRKVLRYYVTVGGNVNQTASFYNMSSGQLKRWVAFWNAFGNAWFTMPKYPSLSATHKEAIILDMWQNHRTALQVAIKHRICGVSSVLRWEKLYHEGGLSALQNKPPGRPPVKKPKPKPQYPAFTSLQEEVLYLRAELDYLKKLQALAQETRNLVPPPKQK